MTPRETLENALHSRGISDFKKVSGWNRCAHPCSPEKDDRRSFAWLELFDGTLMIASQKPAYSKEACLAALGLKFADLFPEKDPRDLGSWKTQDGKRDPIVRGYEYVGAGGEPAGRVSRTAGKTAFPQGHYKNGEYHSGLNGKPLPLFMLPMVRSSVAEGATIYVCEGEKDVLAMWRHGYAATTKPGGASSPWLPEHVDVLRKATVVIIADRDDAGEEAARAAVKALKGTAASITVVQAREGKDAFDHLLAGHSADDFEPRPDLLNASILKLTTFAGDDFDLEEVQFLWEPYLPKGKVVILDADGGTGKTSWFLALAAGLSIGVLPLGGACKPSRTVLFFRDSDNPAEYETVFRANGGKPGWISYSRESGRPLDQAYAEEMIETIKAGGFSLFGLDPFYHFLPPGVNPNDGVAVLPFCDLVNHIAERTGATGIAVRHVGKGKLGTTAASELGLGTAMFRNTLRGQLVMRWHPEERGVVVVTDEKGSILVPRGEPFQFQRRGLLIEYLVDREGDPFEAKSGPGRPPTLGKACHEWLHSFLVGGTRPRTECVDAGIAAGYGRVMIDRAAAAVGVVSVRKGKQAMWSLDPFEEDED